MAQRVKGQEVLVTFTGPDGVEEGFKAIQSFEVTFQEEILTEGYLGETTNRRDDIFNGIQGRIEIHQEDPEYLRFIERATDRSTRRSAAAGVFTILATLQFPNGERPRILLEDVFFGNLPVRVGARNEYVGGAVEFEGASGRFLF